MEETEALLKEPFENAVTQPMCYVLSEEDFKQKLKAYMSLDNHDNGTALGQDDYPYEDPHQQQLLVQALVQAMAHLEDAHDKDSKMPVGRIKKLSPLELNLMAWSVLLEIRDVQRGELSLPRWGKSWTWEEFPTFSARFEAVRQALHKYKAMVASLFDHLFTKRLALNPSAELGRKTANQNLNSKRKKDFDLAMKCKKAVSSATASDIASSMSTTSAQVATPNDTDESTTVQTSVEADVRPQGDTGRPSKKRRRVSPENLDAPSKITSQASQSSTPFDPASVDQTASSGMTCNNEALPFPHHQESTGSSDIIHYKESDGESPHLKGNQVNEPQNLTPVIPIPDQGAPHWYPSLDVGQGQHAPFEPSTAVLGQYIPEPLDEQEALGFAALADYTYGWEG